MAYLIYQPDGSEEPQRWKYVPQKLMSAEREMLEQRTGRTFAVFTKAVLQGDSRCRRALLYLFLKREHPTTRYEDVDFAWDELRVEWTRAELLLLRQQALESPSPEQATILAQIERDLPDAIDDGDEGKARLPIVG